MTRWSMMCFIFNWLQWNVFLNKIISFKVVWCESQDFCLERRWKHLSQICLVCVPCWWFFEDFWMERFPFPVLSVHFRSRVFLIVPSFFNAVASHQCSHLMRLAQTDSTPVKSYSNLSVRRCKNRLFGKQQTGRSDGNLLLWCASLYSAFSRRYLMSALGDISWTSVNIERSVRSVPSL